MCGRTESDLGRFDYVVPLGTLNRAEFGASSVESALLDVQMSGLDRHILVRIDTALLAEAAANQALRWAPLALQHVQYRFVYYYQYKLRILRLLRERSVRHLVLTSALDTDLVFAAQAACAYLDIPLEVMEEAYDPPSSVLSFLASYDLPPIGALSNDVAVTMAAWMQRRRGMRVLYQPHPNLGGPTARGAAPFTWSRSVGVAHGIRHGVNRRLTGSPAPSFVSFDTHIDRSAAMTLDPDLWQGFDEWDLTALNSALLYFRARYPVEHLDLLYEKLQRFLTRSGAGRVVLNADITASGRLLAAAARSLGLQADFLPHGVVWEHLTPSTEGAFHPQRVLAWNPPSRERYGSHDINSITVSHPINQGPVVGTRPLPSDLSGMRVLVMPPEWVGLSFDGRPDCFESDLLEATRGLALLGVRSITVKYHHAHPTALDAKEGAIARLRPFAPLNLNTIASHHSVPQLLADGSFDFAVIGPTTGILEASRSGTPFIAFRAFMETAGLFDGFPLPQADSAEELENAIRTYNTDDAVGQCRLLHESLNLGPHPLAASLRGTPK